MAKVDSYLNVLVVDSGEYAPFEGLCLLLEVAEAVRGLARLREDLLHDLAVLAEILLHALDHHQGHTLALVQARVAVPRGQLLLVPEEVVDLLRALQALGEPDTMTYGDIETAWATACADDGGGLG